MIGRGAPRRHYQALRAMRPARPAPPEPPTTPLLTFYAGSLARAIEAGNRLVTRGQVTRGDQP